MRIFRELVRSCQTTRWCPAWPRNRTVCRKSAMLPPRRSIPKVRSVPPDHTLKAQELNPQHRYGTEKQRHPGIDESWPLRFPRPTRPLRCAARLKGRFFRSSRILSSTIAVAGRLHFGAIDVSAYRDGWEPVAAPDHAMPGIRV